MVDYNVVHLGGRLTRNPELNRTNNGTAVVDLGIAVSNYQGGEEQTSFVDVTVWAEQAENVAQYLTKGSPVLITGRLQQDRWKNEQGENRSKLKVVANDVRFISEADGDSSSDSFEEPSEENEEDDEFSDIPF